MTSPDVPDAARLTTFGSALAEAERYAELLAGDGVVHGHIGPHEVPRLWSRHLMNSALVAGLVPNGAELVDVGSGAGLPGIPIALSRPDVSVTLVEPLGKRATFLMRCVMELGLEGRVTVIRGRAEDPRTVELVAPARWVTARAVAPLDRLVEWCVPLLQVGGHLLAMKGERAADEVEVHGAAIRRLGAEVSSVSELRSDDGEGQVTRVVVVKRLDGARSAVRAPRR